jgi:O-antigen/teichoic acid export membrane protein
MKIDILMLSKMSGEANVGWYNAAASLSNTFGPMVFIFMSVLYPVASRFFVSRQDQLIILYEKSFKYLILIGLPLSAGTTVLAHRIIPLLYGDNFLKAATVLQILCWKFFLIAMSRPVLYMLASINKQKFMAISGGIGAILIIILNLYAIPTFQEIGAAVSVVFAEIVVTCVSWYIVGRYFYFLPFHRILFKPVLATVIMAYVVYQIKNYMDTNLFLLVFLGAAVYTIALFLFNAFDEDDLKIFSKIFRFSFLKSKDKQVKFNLFE